MINAILSTIILLFTYGQDVDTESSIVTFEVSNLGFNTVEGSFSGLQGTVILDPTDLKSARIDVCLDAGTINTGNDKRDKHLRSEDFFEVDKYPAICFVSEKINKTDAGYDAIGKIRMHGVTKSVTIPLTVSGNLVNSTFMVNRKDYNVGEGTSKFTAGYDITLNVKVKLTD